MNITEKEFRQYFHKSLAKQVKDYREFVKQIRNTREAEKRARKAYGKDR